MKPSLGPQILALREQSLTYREIASALNCSLATVSFHCGEGQKQKNRQRARSRANAKRMYVSKVKQEAVCADCKEDYPYFVLEFDHVRGEKVTDISRMTQNSDWSLADIVAEIEKCDIVCANCHKIRTWSRLLKSGSDTIEVEHHYGE